MAVRIAVDAMGGDEAPARIAEGSLDTARLHPNWHIILVGQEDRVRAQLEGQDLPENISFFQADEIIGMDESPVEALRKKPDSSILKCVELVKSGKADALMSAGNTGAMMAASQLGLGVIDGVKRAGIAALYPTHRDHRTVVIDVGANINCKPIHLLQYGLMGTIVARDVMHYSDNPTVAILNIGEEEAKGNSLVKDAFTLMQNADINFIGHVEGHEMSACVADVIVCDGFVGNVLLKATEGLGAWVVRKIELAAQALGEMPEELATMIQKIDYAEAGGALILGVNGAGTIAHGRSNERAVVTAIEAAGQMAEADLVEKIRAAVASSAATSASE